MLRRFAPCRELDRLVPPSQGFRAPAMPLDAYRDGDRFVIHVDLPGVDPDSVDLTVEKNVLTVSAERRWERGDNQQVLVSERPQGSFSRQLFLGEGLDTDRIEAGYDHGVLTVRVPIAEQAQPRTGAIRTGATRPAPLEPRAAPTP